MRLEPGRGIASVRLQAGERGRLGGGGGAESVGVADGADSAWIDGMLIANRMRLDAFIAELARYRRGVLRCDPAVAGQLVTGAFPLHDTDRVLAMLAQVLPVELHARTAYWVTVAARS